MKVFDSLVKHKSTNLGLKLIAHRIPNSILTSYWVHSHIILGNKLAVNSFRLLSRHSLTTRSFSSLSYPSTLLSKTYSSSFDNKSTTMRVRAAHNSGNNDENSSSKSIVLYVQNPLRWLVNKLEFGMLRRTWDPTFKENEFKDGAKLAVSSITQLISSDNFEDLDGLLTSTAINYLRQEVEIKWSDIQRRNVFLTKEDIKVTLPQRVRFQMIDERRLCDVDMLFLALKQSIYEGKTATIFMEIKVRFRRDYTEGLPPEWTVLMFRVTRFSILPR